MARTSMREALDGIDGIVSSRKVANNTFCYVLASGEWRVRLHATDIIAFLPGGDVVFNSGGWKTLTTRDRMNRFAESVASVSTKSGQWYIRGRYDTEALPFYDGVRVRDGRVVWKPGKGFAAPHDAKLKRKIDGMVDAMLALPELPVPSSGDCWLCMLDYQSITPGGMCAHDHIASHIRERYIHGHLLLLALKWAGYRDPPFVYRIQLSETRRDPFHRDILRRALRRFLLRQMGMVAHSGNRKG